MTTRKSRAFRPCADGLESRIAPGAASAPPEIAGLAATRTVVSGTGTVTGRYLAPRGDNRAADEPLEVNLSAVGKVQWLGRVAMTGSLQLGGFRMPNQPDISGTVTLRNAAGSITVRLTGSGGFAEVPNGRFRLNASIVSGTGAYRNLRGIGTADVLFGKNTVRSITTPSPIGGTLTLNLNLRPPVR